MQPLRMVLLAELERLTVVVRDELAGREALAIGQRGKLRVVLAAGRGQIGHQFVVECRTALPSAPRTPSRTPAAGRRLPSRCDASRAAGSASCTGSNTGRRRPASASARPVVPKPDRGQRRWRRPPFGGGRRGGGRVCGSAIDGSVLRRIRSDAAAVRDGPCVPRRPWGRPGRDIPSRFECHLLSWPGRLILRADFQGHEISMLLRLANHQLIGRVDGDQPGAAT